MTETLLEVRDLRTRFKTDDGLVQAVDGVDFTVARGETLAIVGESGSGKSVTCLTLMGLNAKRSSESTGTALYKGKDLLTMSDARLREVRGSEIAMIFQDPMTSLNPVYTIGWQLAEAIRVHRPVSKAKARVRAVEMLNAVGIPRAEQRVDDYPYQFSGGMRQRVMIAMALINNPDLLIADEPTTALDVTTQAQILELIETLQADFNAAVILITHDLGVVAEAADRVLVMYGGRVAEEGTAEAIFSLPRHPYTWGLMGSLPTLGRKVDRLTQIPGTPPSLLRPPPGCRFNPRCRYVMDRCKVDAPELTAVPGEETHREACFLDEETKRGAGATVTAGDAL